jgi:hypothetical protein
VSLNGALIASALRVLRVDEHVPHSRRREQANQRTIHEVFRLTSAATVQEGKTRQKN